MSRAEFWEFFEKITDNSITVIDSIPKMKQDYPVPKYGDFIFLKYENKILKIPIFKIWRLVADWIHSLESIYYRLEWKEVVKLRKEALKRRKERIKSMRKKAKFESN